MNVDSNRKPSLSNSLPEKLDRQSCERARRARDARFDGLFFTAVKSTGIYCRSICPAKPPLEKNVDYYPSAIAAGQAGFRPCLRCRPDSAPHSCAWLGAQTTYTRALSLINQGALQSESVASLSARLGISSRYLNQLFQKNLGISAKGYAIYQQCLFAKKLLHESSLPITQIAFAAGFNSVRRFNEAMQQQLSLAPRDIRNSDKPSCDAMKLKLFYRPPFAWDKCYAFLRTRVIDGLEWTLDNSYNRTIRYKESKGYFSITNVADKHYLELQIYLDDYQHLNAITQRIRALFDVDAPIDLIDQQISSTLGTSFVYQPGLRIPGIWNSFEAGLRAILGQQVSVSQAGKLVTTLVDNLGEKLNIKGQPTRQLFPQPKDVVEHSLAFFKMPQARKDTVRRLAEYFLQSDNPDNIDAWLELKGIGPWTVNYVKIRAAKDPDVWLQGDAGINNALKKMAIDIDPDSVKPWRSYLTFQLWNQLSLDIKE